MLFCTVNEPNCLMDPHQKHLADLGHLVGYADLAHLVHLVHLSSFLRKKSDKTTGQINSYPILVIALCLDF